LLVAGRVRLDGDDRDVVPTGDVVRRGALRILVYDGDVLKDLAFLEGDEDASGPFLSVLDALREFARP
jgi:hypothetical protein